MSACALLLVANKDHALVPVLREYESLLEAKRLRRGLRPGDDVIDAAAADVQDMIEELVKWAHRWLREFRDDPNDQTGAVLFADHCLRQFSGAQAAVELVSARIAGLGGAKESP